jgi:hypothetical protein
MTLATHVGDSDLPPSPFKRPLLRAGPDLPIAPASCCWPGPGIGAGSVPEFRQIGNRAKPCAARAPMQIAGGNSGSTSSKLLCKTKARERHRRPKLVPQNAASNTSARKEPSRALSRTKRTREPSGGRSEPFASTSEKTYAWFSSSAAGDPLEDSFS